MYSLLFISLLLMLILKIVIIVFSNTNLYLFFLLKEGSPCAVNYMDSWHRGIIRGYNDDAWMTVRVELVDLGSTAVVLTESVKILPPEYLNVFFIGVMLTKFLIFNIIFILSSCSCSVVLQVFGY
jgi:hypothetical protein